MALEKREKTLLKVLGVVAVISTIILFRVFNPKGKTEVKVTESVVEEEVKKETPTKKTPSSSRSGLVRRGGGLFAGPSSSPKPVLNVHLDDFQQHTTLDNCWVLIGGEVYDVSGFIVSNPHYANEIKQFCGTFGFETGFLEENINLKEDIKNNSQNMGGLR